MKGLKRMKNIFTVVAILGIAATFFAQNKNGDPNKRIFQDRNVIVCSLIVLIGDI